MTAAMLNIAGKAMGKRVVEGSIKFDWNPIPFVDDKFSLQVMYVNPNPPPNFKTDSVDGTYSKWGDSVTIKVPANRVLPAGTYTATCDEKNKTLTLRRPGFPPLTFKCG